MPGGGNSGSSPRGQKSIGVYIGVRGCALDEMLQLVCRRFSISESMFLKNILRDKLIEWKLLDKDEKPVSETVEKLKSEIDQGSSPLPKSL